MISIIISSHKPEIHSEIEKNIKKTIGLKFEIIFIDNKNKYSLSEAYNLGASKAKYKYLCFVHNDVIFKTKNWGSVMIDIMERDPSVGLIGVAGTKFLSRFSLGWHCPFFSDKFLVGRVGIVNKNNVSEIQKYSNSEKDIEEVVSIDGVFMFTRKIVYKKIFFDDKLLKDFHGYDLDFSLNVVNLGFKAIVTRKLFLLHYSYGQNDKKWFNANKLVLKKWSKKMPIQSNNLNINKSFLFFVSALSYLRYVKKNIEFNFL